MKIKKNIVIMYAISFLQGMVFYGAITTLYRQAVGVNIFQITLIESISLALCLVLELPWGIVADKIGYKNTMIVCCVLYFLSKIVFWQADGFGMFLLERIMLSIVIAGLSGVDSSVIYLSCEKDYVQKAFSIYSSLGTVGMLLSTGIYSLFMSGQYRLTGLCTAITYGIAMILIFFLEEVKPAEKEEKNAVKDFYIILKDTFHRKELFVFLIGIALFSEVHQTITVFLNQLQYVRSGMSDQVIGWVYVAMTLAGLIGVKSEQFTNFFGKRRSGLLLIGLSCVSCVALTITKNPILSVIAIITIRVTFSLLMPLVDTIENQQVRHENRATALSINSVIMDGVAIATNLVFGKLADFNLTYALAISAIFCLIGMVGYSYSCRKFRMEE